MIEVSEEGKASNLMELYVRAQLKEALREGETLSMMRLTRVLFFAVHGEDPAMHIDEFRKFRSRVRESLSSVTMGAEALSGVAAEARGMARWYESLDDAS